MLTVIESPHFQKRWPLYWTDTEWMEFSGYISTHYEDGDVVPGTGGVRKVRWTRAGSGKSGGVRVIYYNRNEAGEVVLMTIYAKSNLSTVEASILKELRNVLENSR